MGKATWKGAAKMVSRWRHQGKTRALNEAIIEQDELQLIDAVAANHTQLTATVKAVRASSQLRNADVTAINTQVNALQSSVKKAIGRFRKLNRATLKQEKTYTKIPGRIPFTRIVSGVSQYGLNTENIEKVLRDRGVNPQVFMAEEKKLLERHKTARDALQKVRAIVDGNVVGARDALRRLPVITGATAWPIPFAKGSSQIDQRLKSLEDALDNATLKADIKIAEDAQHEALKDMQGIIAASRKMWA
ncbi:hypothetical protein HYX13_03895 [Candidatus Woesearchaeota archaeon]|nr:hypothetical protein [Candidatus Woesearchaeota archaeon]